MGIANLWRALAIAILLVSTTCYGADRFPKKENKEVVPRPASAEMAENSYKSTLEIGLNNAVKECIEKNPTQGGTNDCYARSLEAWDKALNEEYKKLLRKLDDKGKDALKNAQREWIKYRDNHYKFLDVYYEAAEGSMYDGMHINDETSIVRDRTLELHSLSKLKDIIGGND